MHNISGTAYGFKATILGAREHKYQSYLRHYIFDGDSDGWLGTSNAFVQKHAYPNQCECNEYYALTQRHYLPPIIPKNPEIFKQFSEKMNKWADDNSIHFGNTGQLRAKTVINNTRQDKRMRYLKAYENIITRRERLDNRFSAITAFVKSEQTSIEKILAKPSRLIQFRSYEYCFSLKSYLLKFDLGIKDPDIKVKLPNGQLLREAWTKYCTDDEQISNIIKAWNRYVSPVALLLDHEKFDGHYEEQHVKNESKFWSRLLGDRRFLSWLLSKQRRNFGRTMNGINFVGKGKRASGDWNTSGGNTASNTFIYDTWCDVANVINYSIFVNGDDSILIVEYQDMLKLMELGMEFFSNLYMKTTIDDIAYSLEEISYCQRRLVKLNGYYRWVKDPRRTLGRFVVSEFKYLKCSDRYLLGKALCELHVSYGIPIIQAFCLRVIHDVLTSRPDLRPLGSIDKVAAKNSSIDQKQLTIQEIGDADRHSFYMAYGITPSQQIKIENDLAASPQITPFVKSFIEKYKFFVYN